LRLVERVQALAAVHPRGALMPLQIMAPENDYWPLPWYLRRFEQAAWSNGLAPDLYAPVLIVSAGLRANLEAQPTYTLAGYFQLRPQVFLQLYVQADLWRAYLEQHRK